MLKQITIVGLLWATAATTTLASDANPSIRKASDWLGHVVTTRDGEELGTVRDFAIDERSGEVIYVVVSVGSFLIENNLIAVAPDALVGAGGSGGGLLLNADPALLRSAQRFATDSRWPASADVVQSDDGTVPIPAPVAAADQAPSAAPPPTGTATIESGSKKATLSASERVITDTAPQQQAKPPTSGGSETAASGRPRPPPITAFDRLDKDGDGVLNRSEFALVITPTDSYSKLDANANGVIDRPEFDDYEQALGAAN